MSISKKNLILSSLGAGLEYYDFILYGLMAQTLSTLFFPDQEFALAKSLALFGIAYLARPLGGLFFGLLGDAKGRKQAFLRVMLLMSLATFSIGCLPTYTSVGSLAPLLLLSLRLIQGFSFGAEVPSAVSLFGGKPLAIGFLFSSVTLGSLLATFAMAALQFLFTPAEILDGAWRLPFLLGGSLAAINYFLRKSLPDTQTRIVPLQEPLLHLRAHLPSLLAGIALILPLAALVLFALTSFPYYPALPLSIAWSAATLPITGWLAERFPPRRLYTLGALGFALFALPLFQFLPYSPTLFLILYQTALSLLTVSALSLLPTLFPTTSRTTALSLCYNCAFAAMSLMPALFSAHAPLIPYFLLSCCLLGTIPLLLLKRQVA